MENSKQEKNIVPPGFPVEIDSQFLEKIGEFQRNWLSLMTRANCEFLSFVTHRLEKDMEAAAEFSRCKNPSEFFQTQFEFIEQMRADYTAEAPKFAKIFNDPATNDDDAPSNGALTNGRTRQH
ncbi:MAG: phasin family protein [Hyphomicrobiaceae bacterium]